MPGMCPTIELLPGPRDFTFQSLMICPQPLGSLFVTPSWREQRADSTRTASLPSLLPGVFPGCTSYTDSLTPAPRRHQASSIKLSLSPNKPIGCAPSHHAAGSLNSLTIHGEPVFAHQGRWWGFMSLFLLDRESELAAGEGGDSWSICGSTVWSSQDAMRSQSLALEAQLDSTGPVVSF